MVIITLKDEFKYTNLKLELALLGQFIYDFAKTVDYQSSDEAKQGNILLLPEGRKPRAFSPRKFIPIQGKGILRENH